MNGENKATTCPGSPRGDGGGKSKTETKTFQVKLDIEHAEVVDDPRQWSKSRKVSDVRGSSKCTGLTCMPTVCHRRYDIRSVHDCWSGRQHLQPYAFEKRCMNKLQTYTCTPPAAIAEIESDLDATAGQLSLTLSLFILIQGGFPLIWSSVSEIRGRKVSICAHAITYIIKTISADCVHHVHRTMHGGMHCSSYSKDHQCPNRHALPAGSWVCAHLTGATRRQHGLRRFP